MAQRKSTPLRTALSSLFPKALLRRLARETGTVQRRRRGGPGQAVLGRCVRGEWRRT
jgi:hypothetical protein